jgi:hypothetical protein
MNAPIKMRPRAFLRRAQLVLTGKFKKPTERELSSRERAWLSATVDERGYVQPSSSRRVKR